MSDDILKQIPFESYYQGRIEKGKLKGDEYSGLCPFHEDTQPSFSANITNGLWKCQAGCGGGNVLTFHARIKNLSN